MNFGTKYKCTKMEVKMLKLVNIKFENWKFKVAI